VRQAWRTQASATPAAMPAARLTATERQVTSWCGVWVWGWVWGEGWLGVREKGGGVRCWGVGVVVGCVRERGEKEDWRGLRASSLEQ
jgi:hypothetical protein